MSDLERLNRRIEANRDRMVELQRVLNRIPAIAPESGGKGESEKARTLVDHLRRLGIEDIKALNAPDERVPEGSRPNILATIPGRDSGRSFWIMTHMDVVPPGDETLWETPP
ncbi:MAG TPA: M20 family metallo-hydrolase, partial [Spirochaetia bacterium]|nr:M20 family metallo-hydrolase [Spirochaetia bacterium]